MYKRETTIINETGLHARPASDFVKTAKTYQADVQIAHAGTSETANAKSIIHVLALGLSKGSQIEITANGADETDAVDGLITLIDSGFGEQV